MSKCRGVVTKSFRGRVSGHIVFCPPTHIHTNSPLLIHNHLGCRPHKDLTSSQARGLPTKCLGRDATLPHYVHHAIIHLELHTLPKFYFTRFKIPLYFYDILPSAHMPGGEGSKAFLQHFQSTVLPIALWLPLIFTSRVPHASYI